MNDQDHPQCSLCSYALYPASGLCTNEECPRHRREAGAEVRGQYTAPPLFHGRKWGEWVLDCERWYLVFRGEPVECREREPYIAYLGLYEIDLERVHDSAGMLDWIYQVRQKVWANSRVMMDLLIALHSIFAPQANLCSWRSNKRINPREFLAKRLGKQLTKDTGIVLPMPTWVA
jgi:hypothetical protein